VSLAAGLGGLGGRTVDCNGQTIDQFSCKRAGASSRFQVLRLNLAHRQAVFGRWEASLRAQVQLAADPLVSSEQIGAGGVDSVRGYYEFEQVGDQGLVLRAELGSPLLATLGPLSLTGMVFGDMARLRVNQPLPAEQANIRMGSLGFGLRALASEGLQLRLDFSLPLVATLKADSNGQLVPTSGRDTANSRRVDLSARYAF
jgi:hemolysin activation/secretion protein